VTAVPASQAEVNGERWKVLCHQCTAVCGVPTALRYRQQAQVRKPMGAAAKSVTAVVSSHLGEDKDSNEEQRGAGKEKEKERGRERESRWDQCG
jgi:hypothetical protein